MPCIRKSSSRALAFKGSRETVTGSALLVLRPATAVSSGRSGFANIDGEQSFQTTLVETSQVGDQLGVTEPRFAL